MAALQDILTASRVTKIISRLRTPGNVLSRHFGMHIGGPNVAQVQGRNYSYDVYDNVRKVAQGKIPGAPAAAVTVNPVGNQAVVLARSAEKVALDYERVAMIRQIGENAGTQDRMGLRYFDKQAGTLKQRQNNFREFIIGSVFNGGVAYFTVSGADIIPSGYSSSGTLYGASLALNSNYLNIAGSFQAGLPMDTGSNIITASWATAATDIPANLMAISSAFQRGVGEPLSRIYCDYATWLYVLQNDKVRQLAGTSNRSFAENTLTNDKAEDGSLTGLYQGSIVGLPWLKWFMYDGGLTLGTAGTTYTTLLPASTATFMIEPDNLWFQGVEGSETVLENDLATPTEEYGFHSWIMRKADPARFELHTLQNFGLELNIPKAIATSVVR